MVVEVLVDDAPNITALDERHNGGAFHISFSFIRMERSLPRLLGNINGWSEQEHYSAQVRIAYDRGRESKKGRQSFWV